jgi:hypothetical protein
LGLEGFPDKRPEVYEFKVMALSLRVITESTTSWIDPENQTVKICTFTSGFRN